MKTLIGIPSHDMIPAKFLQCLLTLRIPGDKQYGFATGSLIYDARNAIAKMAYDGNADYVLWLDSDMVFEPDLYERLLSRIDDEHPIVCALYFTRKSPIIPCVYKDLLIERTEDGGMIPKTVSYTDYPKNSFFQIKGCGFGAVLMKGDTLREIADHCGPPFFPADGFGEDLTFCRNAESLGNTIWCDSTVKVGHIGSMVIDENIYNMQKREEQ